MHRYATGYIIIVKVFLNLSYGINWPWGFRLKLIRFRSLFIWIVSLLVRASFGLGAFLTCDRNYSSSVRSFPCNIISYYFHWCFGVIIPLPLTCINCTVQLVLPSVTLTLLFLL